MEASKQIRYSRKGLNIYYYGKGKGKTTAVMGLAARAAGAGMNVFILQFIKARLPKPGQKLQSGQWPLSSEILFFKQNGNNEKLGRIKTEQCGLGFVGILGDRKQRQEHVAEARKGYLLARQAIVSDQYDLVILDELISALELKLLSERQILNLIKNKPKHIHLAYTGHDPFQKIIQASDLVSEVKMIKHPFYSGILAQRGIDF